MVYNGIMTQSLEQLRQAAIDWVPIQVTYAQDDWVTNPGPPPEQVIMVDYVEYRTRSPLVIQCLFEGSEEEDTDALSIATSEWLHWVNEALANDEDVRFGLLRELGKEFPAVNEIYRREQAAYDRYVAAASASYKEQA